MKLQGRLIAGGIFLVLAVGLVVLLTQADLSGGGAEGDAEAFPTPLGPLFPEDAPESVIAIQVTDNETGAVFAASTEDGATWTVDEAPEDVDVSFGADGGRIMEAAFLLPGVSPARVLAEVETLAPYGLDSARYTVKFRVTGGGEHTLYVGSPNPTGSGFYVRLTERVGTAEEVYLIPAYMLEGVLSFVEDPPVLTPTPTPEPDEG